MMSDVLPSCGGYLPIFVDAYGYIRHATARGSVVHRDTRNLHRDVACCDFVEAKDWQQILGTDELLPAVLELTGEGGGAAVWVRPELREEMDNRLGRWKGCYGAWPTRTFSI